MQVSCVGPDALTSPAAERFYLWWEEVWAAREAGSISSRDATLSATVEYGACWPLHDIVINNIAGCMT